ncbi:MAG: RidA family protein [Actinobacteria bacterium]|nr:RidA family protein [Actinomycetota bacterium]
MPYARGETVGGDDLVAQARQVFANIGALLAAAHASFAGVVKVTYFVRDITEFPRLVALRREIFPAPYPASTAVEITRLLKTEWLIEIEAIAVLPA